MRPARGVPRIEILQFYSQYGRMERIEAAVEAAQHMVVLLALAIVAQHPQRFSYLLIAGDNHPTIAGRAEVLARIKAERRRVAQRTDTPALIARPVCLA